ncbi:hypothetical protein C2E23DRAFT_885019 [Lenzites betulinus]|nr:hypothetical protein C2E23DRAFT_885019 [Lenzites betulinus]
MAASPTADIDGDEHQHLHNPKWTSSPMDVEPAREHMGAGADLDTNGGTHPVDDRSGAGQEPAEYPAPGSNAGSIDNATNRSDGAQRVSSPPPPLPLLPSGSPVALLARLSVAVCLS